MAIIIMVTVIIGALVDVSVYSERFGGEGTISSSPTHSAGPLVTRPQLTIYSVD